jgi:hypothetical protein
LRERYGSVSRAAAAVGVTRQAFHEWLTGQRMSVKHIVAITALLAVGGDASLDTSFDEADLSDG